MFTQPNIGSQLTPEPQRDMLAPAGHSTSCASSTSTRQPGAQHGPDGG
jgi:hypothetical protein